MYNKGIHILCTNRKVDSLGLKKKKKKKLGMKEKPNIEYFPLLKNSYPLLI